jgi:hypothetical protein
MELQIGEMKDLKFGLITRQIERISKHFYLIHDFSCGWQTAFVTRKTLDKVLSGEKSILSLNWK